jgi:hypothetical protein
MTEDEKIKFLKKMGYSGGTIAVALGKETRETYRPTRFSKYDKKPKEDEASLNTTKVVAETSSDTPHS